MNGLISDEFCTVPLVFENPDQTLTVVNSRGLWQVEVNKDQLVVFENGDLDFRNVADTFVENDNHNERIEASVEVNQPTAVVEEEQVKDSCDDGVYVDSESDKDILGDLVETLVLYKCKLCPFKTSEQPILALHFKTTHAIQVKKVSKETSTKELQPNSKTGPDVVQARTAEKDEEQMVYMCANCTEAFLSYSECRVHMALVHKLMIADVKSVDVRAELLNTPTKLSDKRVAPLSPLTPQIEALTNIKILPSCKKKRSPLSPEKKLKYSCTVPGCQVKLSSREFLDKHKRCHSSGSVSSSSSDYICPECSAPFYRWVSCVNHMWKSHDIDIDLYTCHKCDYKTPFRNKLVQHLMIHGNNKNFMCKVCGKTFKQGPQLRNHEVLHLKGGKDEDKLPNWTRRRECDRCGRSFCDNKSLKRHIKSVHAKLKPYSCQVCGHCSDSKSTLRRHSRQHSGEKPFQCSVCTYSTGDHNSLRRHWMRHTGVRPYKCAHCSYATIQSCSLKAHLLRIHPGLPGIFNCSECSFSTISKPLLVDHVRNHKDKTRKPDENRFDRVADLNNKRVVDNNNLLNSIDEDDESNHFFENEPIVNDTGGITIPAE